MTYTEKLKHPKWQKKRLEILERDEFTCQLCGDKEITLHIHHKKYTVNAPWNEPDKNLITICEHCHKEIENLKNDNITENLIVHKLFGKNQRMMLVSSFNILSMAIYDANGNCVYSTYFQKSLNILKELIEHALNPKRTKRIWH